MSARREPWAIVLAAGDGTRLRSVTTDARGRVTPKQFCSLDGRRSLLGAALERAGRVAPECRTLAVVAADHERFWSRESALQRSESLVVQPSNRGTACGILLPLLAILARDADARVLVVPSDHHVADEGVLERSARAALDGLETQPECLTLLGIAPDAPEPEYGWIVPEVRGATRAVRVRRFVEKPSPEEAARLFAGGAVWNSFLVAARASDLLELHRRRSPRWVAEFERAVGDGAVSALYDRIPSADFSRDVLQGDASALRVLVVPPCGWTDLGTPMRLRACLETLPRRRARRPGAAAPLDLSRALAPRAEGAALTA